MKHFRLRRVLFALGLGVGVAVMAGLTMSSSVFAFTKLTNTWPNADQFTGGTKDAGDGKAGIAVNYLIDSNHGDSKNGYFSIFLPQTGNYALQYNNTSCSDHVTSGNTNLYFSIDETGDETDSNGNGIEDAIEDAADRDVSYTSESDMCSDHNIDIPARPASCGSSLIDYRCRVNVRVQMTCTHRGGCDWDDGMIIQYILVVLKDGVPADDALIAPLKDKSGSDNGVIFRKQPSAFMGRAEYNFGVPCTAADTKGTIKFGDTDPTLNGGHGAIRARLLKTDVNGVTTTLNLSGGNRPGADEHGSGSGIYYTLSQSGSFTITMKAGERYQVAFWNIFTQKPGIDIPNSNYISVSIPGDGVYGSDDYNCWSVTPQKPVPSATTASVGDTITWTHAVRAVGDPPTVQYGYRTTVNGVIDASRSNETAWSADLSNGDTASQTNDMPITPDLDGKIICRYTVVSPGAFNDSSPKVSEGTCITVGAGSGSCGIASFAASQGALVGLPYAFTITAGSGTPSPNRIVAVVTGSSFTQSITDSSLDSGLGNFSFTPPTVGSYDLNWTEYDDAAGQSVSCGPVSLDVGMQPYFEVKGADILAYIEGATSTGTQGIISWNNDNNSAYSGMGGYQGAGSQLAAITSANLLHYVTAGQNTTSGTLPSSLAFANSPAYTGTGYGGKFQSDMFLDSGYDAALAQTDMSRSYSTGQSLSGLDGFYYATDDVTIPASTVSTGRRVTIVVAPGKNVYIAGNVDYQNSTNYGAIGNIPHLAIYVKADDGSGGNILVAGSATTLRGTFSTDGGTFYSCATNSSTPVDALYAQTNRSSYYDACNTQLTVNGNVYASNISLMRTFGSWNQIQGAAETFSQSPESWLNTAPTTSNTFDNYTTLPPVL